MIHRPHPRVWQRPRAAIASENKLVKSASRVFEILEFLDDMRRPTTVMEIAEALGYPQSSTSALLSSMVAMGYLVYEPSKRTYMTSSRVALLGSWVNEPFFAEGKLISLMKALYAQFGHTVLLGMRNGLKVQFIHILQPPPEDRLFMPTGSSTPLAICAGGHAMMATMSSEEVTRIALRYNAEAAEGASLVRVRQLHEDLELVRERGYAAVYDAVLRGGALVAARLPQIEGQRQMVIAVGGQSAVIREAEAEIAGAILAGIADLADSTRVEALPEALAPLEAEDGEVLRSA